MGQETHIGKLVTYIAKNIYPQVKNIRVVSYFFVSVICVGGAGIWMPWFREDVEAYLPGNTIFTFVFALFGTLICNKLYFQYESIRNIKNFYEKEELDSQVVNQKKLDTYVDLLDLKSIMSAWGMLFGCFVLLIVTFSYARSYSVDSISGWVSLILSLILYFIVLAEDIDKDSSPIAREKGEEDADIILDTSNDKFTENFFRD